MLNFVFKSFSDFNAFWIFFVNTTSTFAEVVLVFSFESTTTHNSQKSEGVKSEQLDGQEPGYFLTIHLLSSKFD